MLRHVVATRDPAPRRRRGSGACGTEGAKTRPHAANDVRPAPGTRPSDQSIGGHSRPVWCLLWARQPMKLTVRDAAKLLQTTEAAVHRWIREKSIPFHRVNDSYRFHRAELLEWATSRGIRVSSREFQAEEAEGGAPMPRLADALEVGGVHYRVPGADRASVLRAVVEHMPIDLADRGLLCDFLLAREALGSTGVGEGIAI